MRYLAFVPLGAVVLSDLQAVPEALTVCSGTPMICAFVVNDAASHLGFK